MAGRIPPQFIDELLARVDIVDVIDSRVPLKKAGREYKACCPFHGEKTPSFTVSTEKQFYHCFGCGAHGTALGFLMEYEHLSFPEAVETLAQGIGLAVPHEGGGAPDTQQDAPIYDALSAAKTFYSAQFKQHTKGSEAAGYLRQRGLSGDVAKRYGLGYAPPGYESIQPAIGQRFPTQTLQDAGLLTQGERGRPYDRFRDRVMFPIHDRRGRVIGFGGRVIGNDEPKYLNSPETPVFHKGRELYGLYEARTAGAKLDALIVVEGYMDVVSLAQFGIHYGVAALGTSITREQVELCFRAVQSVVFCFDGDRAGRSAAWRAAENALPALSSGKTVRFLFLPDGHDPDSLVREEGPEGFETRMAAATPYSEYFFSNLTEDLELATVDGRAALTKVALPLINQIRDPIYRELMMEELSRLARTGMDRLERYEELDQKPAVRKAVAKRPSGSPLDPTRSPVRMALALLMHAPGLAKTREPPVGLAGLSIKGADLLVMLWGEAAAMANPNSGALLERLRDHPAHGPLAGLLTWDPPFGDDALKQEWAAVIDRLQTAVVDQRWGELTSGNPLTESERLELARLQQLKLERS